MSVRKHPMVKMQTKYGDVLRIKDAYSDYLHVMS